MEAASDFGLQTKNWVSVLVEVAAVPVADFVAAAAAVYVAVAEVEDYSVVGDMHLDVEVCSVVGIHPAVGKELYSAVVDSAVYFDADIVAVVVEEETCSEVDFAAAAEVDSADDFAVAAEEETCSEEEDVHLDIEDSAVVDSAVD